MVTALVPAGSRCVSLMTQRSSQLPLRRLLSHALIQQALVCQSLHDGGGTKASHMKKRTSSDAVCDGWSSAGACPGASSRPTNKLWMAVAAPVSSPGACSRPGFQAFCRAARGY